MKKSCFSEFTEVGNNELIPGLFCSSTSNVRQVCFAYAKAFAKAKPMQYFGAIIMELTLLNKVSRFKSILNC